MTRKNLFTGQPQGESKHAAPPESIATLLSRAEASNPLPHQSGRRGLEGLGSGRRSGGLTRGRRSKERARQGSIFGIND